MKKVIPILLVAIMILSLCSCGKSEAAINADNLILEIGEVTLASEDKIKRAEAATQALTVDELGQLEQWAVLKEARETYDELVTQQAISDLEAAIDAIGVVTLEDQSAYANAEIKYNKASEAVKAGITNHSVLQQAGEELSNLKVQNVTDLINQIGTVTLESGETIELATEKYQALTSTEKKRITNHDVLVNATTRLKELETQEKERVLNNALSKLKTDTDKVTGTTWYEASTMPYYADSRSYVLPYFGMSDTTNHVWLRLKFHYTGSRWIFFENITISVDGTKYYKSFNYGDVRRDNDAGDVWEVADILADELDIRMLKAIADSEETIVRFSGDDRDYDLTIKSSDKTAISQVLTAYELLKDN